jgi:hypothetical protein
MTDAPGRATHYLVFDERCSRCARLAREITASSDGRLQAASLGDASFQKLLSRARSDWRWEPTMLRVQRDRVCIWTGIRMCVRLVMLFGLRRSLRVARLAHAAGVRLPLTRRVQAR